MLVVMELRCNYQRSPFGITGTPVLSWQLLSEKQNTVQEAYQFHIYNADKEIYDSGKIYSSQSIEIVPEDFCVVPGTVYQWKIKIWDNHGEEAENNDYFEGALGHFSANWIEPSIPGVKYEKPIPLMSSMILIKRPKSSVEERLLPVTLLRREFEVKKGLIKARAYATAHGVYSIQFNSKASDERLLAPEFTTYQMGKQHYRCWMII